MTNKNQTVDESLLTKYGKEIDLYKFYVDIGVKNALFAFGITGALLSYFFANQTGNVILVWALTLPIVMNTGLFILCCYSITASREMMLDHQNTCRKLNSLTAFDMRPLPALCQILAGMYGLVSIGLLLVIGISIL